MSPANRTTRAVAVGSLAVLAVAWGMIPLIVREDVPSTHLVAMRITLGAVVLVAFSVATAQFSVPRRRWKGVTVLGLVLAAHWLLFFLAIKLTTVAVALAVVYLGPVLAAVLAGPILGESVSRRAAVGLGVAVVGMLLVVRPGSGATIEGVAAGVISGSLLAAIMVIGKPLAGDLGGLAVATWELIVASVLLAPFTVQAVRFSSGHWFEFAVLGALFTGVAGVVYWTSMRVLPVAVVSVIMYLEPASAVVWAALFLGEYPDALTWIGVAVVVAAGTIATRSVAGEEVVGVTEAL
ncbi:MAG: DMT family transporter [Actinomycetota bacterium]